MRKTVIILPVIMLLFQSAGFSQNRTIDSLKAALQNAKEDTTRLRLYLAMGEASDKKDKLRYGESAIKLSDKLLSSAIAGKQRQKILNQEGRALYLITGLYTNSSGTDWDKVIQYVNNRLKFIEKSGNKKRIAETLSLIAYGYLQKNDSSGFLANASKSLKVFSEIKDSAPIVGWHLRLNYYYLSAGNLSKAFDEIQSALKVARELNYKEGIGISLQQLGDLYRDNGEDAGAMENYNKALAIFKETKDTANLYNVTGAIAGFYYTRHMSSKAIDHYNKMFAFAHSGDDARHKTASIYKWMGMVYKDDNDHRNALLNLQKSLSAFTSLNDQYERKYVLDEVGSVYNNQGDLEKATDYHNRSIKLADTLHWAAGKARSEYLLALDYFAKRDYTTARAHNDKVLSSLRKQFDIKPTSEAALLASRIDSATGDGNSAYAHYKEYILLTNKIKGEEIRKEAQKESFQNELARKNIEQEKKDIEVKRIKNVQYFAIAVLVVIVLAVSLIVLILHKNNKSKQQANIALRKEKEKVESTLSELKLAQAQLVQSEKMASLGELTAGIAHEIQNPLNFVNNFSEVSNELMDEMDEELDKGDVAEAKAIAAYIKENLVKIQHHGKRADNIVKGMLEHSRTNTGEKELTDINALADESLRLSYHGMMAKDKDFNADLKTNFDDNIGDVNLVRQDVSRVLLNLFNNAFYAVNEKKTKSNGIYVPAVVVCTKKLGNKVEIVVKDNGYGLQQNIADKIFQPFFTTKPTGQGTGLGLSLSYDIIKAYGGEIKVESIEGEGAEFTIQLPVRNVE